MAEAGIAVFDLVVVGTSLGGLQALETILAPLPEDFPVPILAVQHLPPDSGRYLAEALDRVTPLRVQFAAEGDVARPGHVHLAPPGRHLLVGPRGVLNLSRKDPVNFSRPAIDPLFQTAAEECGRRLIAVVLTGASRDGADGLREVQLRGGASVVQHPESAEAAHMPVAALAAVPTAHRVWLDQIGPFLWTLVREGGS